MAKVVFHQISTRGTSAVRASKEVRLLLTGSRPQAFLQGKDEVPKVDSETD